jgi:hypothetical protein
MPHEKTPHLRGWFNTITKSTPRIGFGRKFCEKKNRQAARKKGAPSIHRRRPHGIERDFISRTDF